MGQLFFKKPLQIAIVEGRKRTTIRRWQRPRVRAGQRAYAPGVGWLAIEWVEPIELGALRDEDAAADGFANLAELLRVLRELYPDLSSDGKQWFRVRLALDRGRQRRVCGAQVVSMRPGSARARVRLDPGV